MRFGPSSIPFVGAALLALGACGGSSGPTPTPTPTPTPNASPTFTSPSSATVSENTLPAYSATATDANGDPLTFSISGGADGALFQITPAGAVSFRAAPDFEVPRDADSNNVYLVDIAVSDGKVSVTLAVSITVTDVTGGTAAIRSVATVGANPTNLVPVPGDATRVFVTERGGRVLLLNPQTGALAAQPFLDVSAQLSTTGERGLLGFAPAADVAQSGTIYLAMTNTAGELEIRRYRTFAADHDRADPATADLILRVPAASAPEYAAGWIGFGPDGLLSITTGSGLDPNSDINDLRGKVLRIDVSQDGYPADPERDYTVPASNPGGSGRDEIFVRGFAMPRTASIDRATGNMFVGDLGARRLEPAPGGGNRYNFATEINLIRPQDGGLDYQIDGGDDCLRGRAPGAPIYCTRFPSTPAFGVNLLTAGPAYRGAIESLQGRIYYAFRTNGTTGVGTMQDITAIPSTTMPSRRNENLSTILSVSAFGEDAAGNVYFLQFDGRIYVLEPA